MQIVETASSTVEIHEDRVRKIARILSKANQLEMEASCLKTLEGQGVSPKLIDTGKLGDLPYLEMERVEGETLSKAKFATTDKQIHFCWALLDCLCTIHENNILHRDLKPSNIIVKNDEPTIIDFGCATLFNESDESKRKIIYSTPKIIPPEIHNRENDWNQTSDIFSLGVCFYYVCSGRYPFKNDDLGALVESICYDQAKPLDHPLWPIIKNCLQKDPSDRYQDCNPILGDMIRVLKDEPIEDLSPSVATETKRVLNHSIRPFLVFGTVFLLAGLSALLIFKKYFYEDGLIAIKFENTVKVKSVCMENSHFRYTFGGDEIARVKPGCYFATFTKEDGSVHEAVRIIREVEPELITRSPIHSFKEEKSVRIMSGVKKSKNPRKPRFQITKRRLANGKMEFSEVFRVYYSTINWSLEHSKFRLPTRQELVLLGKNEHDYLFLEKANRSAFGILIPISRKIPAKKTLDFSVLISD